MKTKTILDSFLMAFVVGGLNGSYETFGNDGDFGSYGCRLGDDKSKLFFL